ncbi:apolipoprotein A-Ib [Betta splendens]|uniref:Apolipoprotein A-Ib n=1 Tax=Betta splendens TaxID=158456 RepID=A0A6P7PBK3_BETSP|nr:apolipoprotein A-Ib [Betta splendens]
MKFVALVCLLLAVGSQASPMLSDAPSQLEHFRSGLNLFLDQLKGSLTNAVNSLDDAEYKDIKERAIMHIDGAYTYIKQLQAQVAPVTDSVVGTISEATEEFQKSVAKDLVELEPMRAELRKVLKEHMDQYQTLLKPVVDSYIERRKEDMKAMRAQFQPTFEELRKKVAHNVEETKQALVPLLKAVGEKVANHIKAVRETLGPHVEEYKEQVRQAYEQAQKFDDKAMSELREKINPAIEAIKTNMKTIYDVVIETITKDRQN